MQTPSFKEDHISQIPALQFLQNLGYIYLTPEEALKLRNNKTTNVLLEDVLRKQLKEINAIRVSSQKTTVFSDANIEQGIRALKDIPMQEGYLVACEHLYNLLTLGIALEQSIDGDKKSFPLKYIDWENEHNVFHVTEEFPVMRANSKDTYRPDLVLFINGIPIAIIECKRPDMKDPLAQAISQHLRNQQEDGIRGLYVYAQVLLSIATNQASYATNATEEKLWSKWEERFESAEDDQKYRTQLDSLKNKALSPEQKNKLFADRFKYVRQYFDAFEQGHIEPTKQDEYLFGLLRPERLLDLIFNFVIFEAGDKKIARYQQFFVLKKTMDRVRRIEQGKRKGGVIWHTQGSGKSLTMVMLAQAIALEKSIHNPKIVLVTDRIDLDAQISGTFRKCGKPVLNAATGENLLEHLASKSDAVVTTVINKFVAAVNKAKQPFTSPDIFVLVDEGHRTQYGMFHIKMMKALPNACFIAFTGTPLMKKEKNTAVKFGGIIDTYTVKTAVADKSVVPLLYEGRYAIQKVNEKPIDNYFRMISEPLTPYQRADLKNKFSRADQLNVADQKVYAIAWDISLHYRNNWQGTGFKGQLVCQSKDAAVKYKNFLDEIGIVSSEVLISPPDEREGEDSAFVKSTERVKQFWQKMMDQHGNASRYQKNIIHRFKNTDEPEIIIVVDKLLTGFDAPVNTVLYITRALKEHSLLQAIARVNRVYPSKDYGYIIDYFGVLGELGEALALYSQLEDYDESELAGTLSQIKEEIKKLPQKHSELADLFKTIPNKRDAEAFEHFLRDEAIRAMFYEKVSAFSRTLKLAMSSVDFHKETSEQLIKKYTDDAKFYLSLRSSVAQRYSDTIDFSEYEDQIQKLIDKHIETDEVKPITQLVNIFDQEKFQQEIENAVGEAAKADRIASRTAKHITEKMNEDPAFYKKFSEMLKDTINEYEQHRISEALYLTRTKEIMDEVLARADRDTPPELLQRGVARAFYGLGQEFLESKLNDAAIRKTAAVESALGIDEIIRGLVLENGVAIVDWQDKTDLIGKIQIQAGDYLIDTIKDKYHLDLTFDEVDDFVAQCIEVAKVRYK